MKQAKFSFELIVAHLEDMIHMDLATNDEQLAYEQLMSSNTMNKNTYNTIVKKMQQEWNNKFQYI